MIVAPCRTPHGVVSTTRHARGGLGGPAHLVKVLSLHRVHDHLPLPHVETGEENVCRNNLSNPAARQRAQRQRDGTSNGCTRKNTQPKNNQPPASALSHHRATNGCSAHDAQHNDADRARTDGLHAKRAATDSGRGWEHRLDEGASCNSRRPGATPRTAQRRSHTLTCLARLRTFQ